MQNLRPGHRNLAPGKIRTAGNHHLIASVSDDCHILLEAPTLIALFLENNRPLAILILLLYFY